MVNRVELKAAALPLGLLALAIVLFYWEAFTLQGTFFLQDVMVQNYPFRDFFARSLKSLSLPLWCPEINYGFPLFAEGQAGPLYPFNVLTGLLLPTYAGLNYNLVFHMWLAGAGTYWFLRLLGCLRASSLCAGLVFSCSGFLLVRAMSFNYIDVCAWMPFLFALVESAVQKQRWSYLVLGAGVVALQFLAGHPQAATYAVGAALLYGLYRGSQARCGRLFWILLLAAPVLGAGMAAVQLLPTMELVSLSGRGEGVGLEAFLSMSLPPERLITFLLPNYFGNSSTGSYWGREAGFFIQLCGYVGAFPLLLSLVAWRLRSDSQAGFFISFCGLAIILVLGRYTGLFQFLYHLPGLDYFRIPTRFLQWLAFGLAVLSGFGLDSLLRDFNRASRSVGLWICGLFALGGGLVTWAQWHQLQAKTINWPYQLGADLDQYGSDLEADIVRFGLVLAAALALFVVGGWRGYSRRGPLISVAALLIVYAELYGFGRHFNAVIPAEVYQRTPETAAAIHRDNPAAPEETRRAAPRLISMVSEQNSPFDWHGGWAVDSSSYRHYPATLRLYTGSLYGLANVMPGWSPLHLQRQWEFSRGYPRFLELGAVQYVVSHRPLPGGQFELAFTDGVGLKVYRNRSRLPRAYVVGGVRVIPNSRRRLAHMLGNGFDSRYQVVSETAVPGMGAGHRTPPQEAEIVGYENGRVELALGEHSGGLLVLTDTYYPGWRAWVDGEEAKIFPVNHVFRGVPVKPGASRVDFVYEPGSFVAGVWISVTTTCLFAMLLVWGWRRRFESGPEATVSAHRFKAWTLQILIIVVIHALVTQWPDWARAVERSNLTNLLGG